MLFHDNEMCSLLVPPTKEVCRACCLRKICYSILLVTYRFIASEEGLFDQIRVDHGKEFYLSLFVQEQLAHLRYNPQRDSHRQTTSKKVSVNSRFLLPVPLLLPVTHSHARKCIFYKKKKKRLKHFWGLLPVIQSSINLPTQSLRSCKHQCRISFFANFCN